MPTITAIRSRIRETRNAHAARAALEREISSYNSPSDLDDLHAILDRYSDQETVQIRRDPGRPANRLSPAAPLATLSPTARAVSAHGPHAAGVQPQRCHMGVALLE